MKISTTLAAALLALTPSLGFAMGCHFDEHKADTAMSCAEGTVIDEETGTCVPVVTG